MSWHQHCTRFSVCTKCNKWNRIDWHKCRNCGERYTLRAPTEQEVAQYKQMMEETNTQVNTMRFVRGLRRTAAMEKTKTITDPQFNLTVDQFIELGRQAHLRKLFLGHDEP